MTSVQVAQIRTDTVHKVVAANSVAERLWRGGELLGSAVAAVRDYLAAEG